VRGAGWAGQLGCWVAWVGFRVSFLSYFYFLFYFWFLSFTQTIEFKLEFEFNLSTQTNKIMHQHECNNKFNLEKILKPCEN